MNQPSPLDPKPACIDCGVALLRCGGRCADCHRLHQIASAEARGRFGDRMPEEEREALIRGFLAGAMWKAVRDRLTAEAGEGGCIYQRRRERWLRGQAPDG